MCLILKNTHFLVLMSCNPREMEKGTNQKNLICAFSCGSGGSKTSDFKKYHKISILCLSVKYKMLISEKYQIISLHTSKNGCKFGCRFEVVEKYEYKEKHNLRTRETQERRSAHYG